MSIKRPCMKPEIAIVEPNTLTAIGLQSLLERVVPHAVIRSFQSFAELTDDTPDMYVHYFISSQIYFEHAAFFLERRPKTIVLVRGSVPALPAGIPVLNISQNEKELMKSILQLHQHGHSHVHAKAESVLSAREVEVLVLVAKGLLNKEIADKLNISLTTVITHRKNIVEKLGIRSASGLAIYAVMQGYLEADRI